MIVGWQTQVDKLYVPAWRILEASGMTKSRRHARNYTVSGYGYLNGGLMNLKSRVQVGTTFTLELRFPNGKVISEEIKLVPHTRHHDLPQRQASPGTSQHLTDPDKYFRRG